MAATKSRKSTKATKTTKGKKPYKKKAYSEEEKVKFAEDREKKISAAKQALITAIEGLDSNESWMNFLEHVAKRRRFSPSRLSFINQMLVYMQYEEATAVATYQRWRKIKRWPIKGSVGIMIFRPVPITIPIEKATPADIADGSIFTDKSGRTMVRTGRIFFNPMYVFDIAQTEGEELPPDWLAPPEMPDFEDKEVFASSVEKLAVLLENKTDGYVKGVQVIDREKIPAKERHPTADGWYSTKTKKIIVIRDKNRAKMFATLVHEAGHALMHGDDQKTSREQKEIEAESVAYVVTKALGLDTGVASVVYLASWSKGKKDVAIKQIEESAKRIVRASNQILDLLMPIDDDEEESVLGAEEPFVASEALCSSARRVREPKPSKKANIKGLNPKELAIGTKHELEHVHLKKGQKPTKKQLEFAQGIAVDHLREEPKYYSKLKKCGIDEPAPNTRKVYPVGTVLSLGLIRLPIYATSEKDSTLKETTKKVSVEKILPLVGQMIVKGLVPTVKTGGKGKIRQAYSLSINKKGQGNMWAASPKPIRYEVHSVEVVKSTGEPYPKHRRTEWQPPRHTMHFGVNGKTACGKGMNAPHPPKMSETTIGVDCGLCERTEPYKEQKKIDRAAAVQRNAKADKRAAEIKKAGFDPHKPISQMTKQEVEEFIKWQDSQKSKEPAPRKGGVENMPWGGPKRKKTGRSTVRASKINQTDYKYYVLAEEELTILAGNEYKEDAKEAKYDMPLPWSKKAKIVGKSRLRDLGIDPNDNKNWADSKFFTRTGKDGGIESLKEPVANCQTSKNPMTMLKSTARKMGATVTGSDIKFKSSKSANEFEKLLKEDQYTYTKNRLTFTVGCGEASLTIAALGEPKPKRYIVKKGDHGVGWKIYDKKSKKDVNWFAYKYDAADAAKEYNTSGYKPGHKIRKAQTNEPKAKRRMKSAAKKTSKRIGSTTKKAGKGIKSTAKKAGKGIKSAARKTGKSIKSAAKRIAKRTSTKRIAKRTSTKHPKALVQKPIQ